MEEQQQQRPCAVEGIDEQGWMWMVSGDAEMRSKREGRRGWGGGIQLPASGLEAGAAAGETGHLLSRRPWRRRLRAPPLLRRRKKWRLLLQLRLGLDPSKKPRRREGETRRTF